MRLPSGDRRGKRSLNAPLVTCETPVPLVREEPLSARLRETAARTFAALGGSGLGRCDVRMNEAGEIFLLEINPNCHMFCPENVYCSVEQLCIDYATLYGPGMKPFDCGCLSPRCRGVIRGRWPRGEIAASC